MSKSTTGLWGKKNDPEKTTQKKPKHVYTKPSLPLCCPEKFQTQPSGLNKPWLQCTCKYYLRGGSKVTTISIEQLAKQGITVSQHAIKDNKLVSSQKTLWFSSHSRTSLFSFQNDYHYRSTKSNAMFCWQAESILVCSNTYLQGIVLRRDNDRQKYNLLFPKPAKIFPNNCFSV